ncbi:hypothetical protein GCM10027347_50840 [Larkinella harenae]
MQVEREEYDAKPLFIREGALKLWGVPLAIREDLCRVRYLYSLNEYFVEECHDKETGKLTCICSFSRVDRLTPYLEQIELSCLDIPE